MSSAVTHVTGSGQGTLEIIIGPMRSGKSSELIARVRSWECMPDVRVLKLNHTKDTRKSGCFIWNRHEQMPCIKVSRLDNFTELDHAMEHHNVIVLDEANFFGPDLITWARRWRDAGKHLIVAGLSGSFQQTPFGHVLELIPLATEPVQHVFAKCRQCRGKPAPFTKLLPGSGSADTNGILVGDQCYEPTCLKHFPADTMPC